MEPPTIQAQLDFDAIKQIALIGINRASVFMGLATNMARLPKPVSHLLDDRAKFVFVLPDGTEAQARGFVESFETWVIANGLREMMEAFSNYLTEVYSATELIAKKNVDVQIHTRNCKKFDRDGVEGKLCSLTPTLELDRRFDPMFASLNQARNCLAHRLGVVGNQDVSGEDGSFELIWRTRAFFLEDGTDLSQALHNDAEVPVSKGQKLFLNEVGRSRLFALGSYLKLTRHELNEVCFGMLIAVEVIQDALVTFGRKHGMVIDVRQASI